MHACCFAYSSTWVQQSCRVLLASPPGAALRASANQSASQKDSACYHIAVLAFNCRQLPLFLTVFSATAGTAAVPVPHLSQVSRGALRPAAPKEAPRLSLRN